MKNLLIIAVLSFALAFVGCTGGGSSDTGSSRVAQPSDTLYTKEAALDAFATDPDRALLIIDSAEIVGNLTKCNADVLRAKVYSCNWEEIHFDSAILIGERLMLQEEVINNPSLHKEVLEILLNACRLKKDYEQALHWATELDDLYLSRGETTEALRTDAEISTMLIRIGQQDEGFSKLDSVIRQLEGKRKFNEMDASIIALKRKAEICIETERFAEAIPAAQRMFDLLDDYERHPADYHDGTVREPSEADRPGYIDFYRGKAYAYLSASNASLGESAKAREYLDLYDNTVAGQSLTGRFMTAPTLRKLGEYDRVLTIYDEVEQQLGTDTMNANYVEILLGRAEIYEVQGRHEEARAYRKRYSELNTLLTENILQGKAHLYAARFHASEQQREIDRHREVANRAVIIGTTIGIVCLLMLLFALYAFGQWRKTQRRNHILAQQISEAVEYKQKYKELSTQNSQLSTPNSELSTDSTPSTLNSQLNDFSYLRDLIEREQLYLDPNFERQMLIKRTGLSKERIGAAFAQGSDHERLTTLVREMRLDYAVRLMNEHPEMSVEQVCQSSGFSNADTFTRNFRAKFGMTPTAYRVSKG